MELVAGLVVCFLAGAVAIVFATKAPGTALLWSAALGVRLLVLAINNLGMWGVPGGSHDAKTFLGRARQYNAMPWPEFWQSFSVSDSFLYSWLGGLLYKLTVESDLMFQSLNVLFGIIVVFLVFRIAQILWDDVAAYRAGWLAALYPFAVFNSVITLREEVAIMLFLFGLLAAIKWIETRSPLDITIALAGFCGATLFHGGWAAAVVGFLVVVARETLTPTPANQTRYRSNADLLTLLSVAVVTAFTVYVGNVEIQLSSGIGNPVEQVTGRALDTIEESFGDDMESLGGSGYPGFVIQGSPYRQPWLIPLRVTYFVFSPFPWDIKTTRHALGLVGTVMYLWITWQLWRARRVIVTNRQHQAVLIIAGMVIFTFAMGTSNIGTALRHRTKVFGALVAVCVGGLGMKRR